MEYGYTHGDLIASPGILRIRVDPDKAGVDYVRAVLSSKNAGRLTNETISFHYEVQPR
jgi:hypothetical protein